VVCEEPARDVNETNEATESQFYSRNGQEDMPAAPPEGRLGGLALPGHRVSNSTGAHQRTNMLMYRAFQRPPATLNFQLSGRLRPTLIAALTDSES